MEIGDDERARRAEDRERRDEKRKKETRREDRRRFSDLMERRRNSKNRAGGGERLEHRRDRIRSGRNDQRQRCRTAGPGRGERCRGERRSEGRRCQQPDRERRREPGPNDGERCRYADQRESVGREESWFARVRAGADGSSGQTRGVESVRERVASSREANETFEGRRFSEVLDRIGHRMVEAVRVGRDETARRAVFLEVSIPGRGEVRIRIRREGRGHGVRMRTDDETLARRLRRGTDELRRRGAEQDVEFTSIRVIG